VTHASTLVTPKLVPYGAPELKEAFRRYLAQGVFVGSAAWILLFLLGFGGQAWLKGRAHEVKVTVVTVLPPCLPPPQLIPQITVRQPAAPPSVGIAVPVPDIQAPPDHTFAAQDEMAPSTSATPQPGEGVAIAPDEDLPPPDQFVPVEELPAVVTMVSPIYPDMAREAGVDGTELVKALVDKAGKVRDVIVIKSIPMLDASAVTAVRQWVFKPALSNNKPVAVWVAVPVRFALH